MKRNIFLSALIISIIVFAISCKKAGKTGLLVPEDAAMVIHINNASLSSKLSMDEIRQTNWFKELSKHTTDTMAEQLLKDPASSGVDPRADFVFFLKKQGRNGYFVMQGFLKDAAAYERYAKKISDDATPQKDGDMSFLPIHEAGMLAWDKLHFVYVMTVPFPDAKGAFMGQPTDFKDRFNFNKLPADSLKKFGKDVLTLKDADKLDNDSRFVSLVKDGSDIQVWTNTSGYYKDMMGPMLSMMKLNILTDDNVSATSLNFDNGRITMNSKQYFGKEMRKLLADYKPDPVSAAVINRIPSQNVVGAIAMNYSPAGLKELLRVTGMDGLAAMFLAKADFSVDDFVKANKGELLLSFSDLEVKENSDTFTHRSKPDAKILFATSVNDKKAFEKLISVLEGQTKNLPSQTSDGITYKLDNGWFAAGNSNEQVSQFLSGGNNKIAFADKISGHPFGIYIDLQKILTTALMSAKDSSAKSALEASVNMWQEVVATGGDYKDNAVQFHAEINLVDKNTNSLKQLNQYIDKLSAMIIEEKNKLHFDDMHSADTTVMSPVEKGN